MTHLSTQWHTWAHSDTPEHTVTHLSTQWHTWVHRDTPEHTVTHLSTKWHTWAHRDTQYVMQLSQHEYVNQVSQYKCVNQASHYERVTCRSESSAGVKTESCRLTDCWRLSTTRRQTVLHSTDQSIDTATHERPTHTDTVQFTVQKPLYINSQQTITASVHV